MTNILRNLSTPAGLSAFLAVAGIGTFAKRERVRKERALKVLLNLIAPWFSQGPLFLISPIALYLTGFLFDWPGDSFTTFNSFPNFPL